MCLIKKNIIKNRNKFNSNKCMIKNSKRKGCEGERKFAKFLREHNLDNNAWRNYGSGSTIYKSDVVNKLNYNFEVKVGKYFSLPKALKQTQRDAEMSHTIPSVVFHLDGMPEGEWWITISADTWAELIQKSKEPILTSPDRQASWHIRNLIQSAKQVLKDLD